MSPAPGSIIGPFKVVGPLGAGGMGEVFRATDSRLGRDVALKLLPELLAREPERLARFQREARLLASLNHPNIGALHGLEESATGPVLVMELVEGPTLAQRIAAGALPLDDALPIARQIAEALEYAHEHGVVHRDLKPANVKLRPDGTVKLLDFGLARAMEGEAAGSPDSSLSPTLTAATQLGVILGTSAYMSPEQARGKSVDRRADIWAFGCVMMEALTGRRVFAGETVSETLAAVIKDEPDWGSLPPDTPRPVASLIRRCLVKDPRRRLRDIGEARLVIEDWLAGGSPPEAPAAAASAGEAPSFRRRALPWAVAMAGIAVAAAALWSGRESAPSAPLAQVSVALEPEDALDAGLEDLLLAVSPDGRSLVYCARRDGVVRLHLKKMQERDARPLSGTEGAYDPFFSPDGRWIAFFSAGKLRKVSVDGGAPVDLADSQNARGGVWLPDGTIVAALGFAGPLVRVSDSGGTPRPATTLDAGRRERTHRWPDALPGGEWILYTAGAADNPGTYEDCPIVAFSLRTGERRVLVEGASFARYAESGHLVYSRAGVLFAAPFDASDPRLTGPAVPVLDGVAGKPTSGAVHFSLGRDGTLAYVRSDPRASEEEMVWVTRTGEVEPLPAPPRSYYRPRLSPDGSSILVTIGPGLGQSDVWRYDLARDTLARLTFDQHSLTALWMPDGRRMVFLSETAIFRIMVGLADGDAAPRVIRSDAASRPLNMSGVTPDGGWALFTQYGDPESDIEMARLEGGSETRRLFTEPLAQWGGVVSTDGRWLAYVSSASGRPEVYVRPFQGEGRKWQISTAGGFAPCWSHEADELFFLSGRSMMVVAVEGGAGGFSAGPPRKLFDLPAERRMEESLMSVDVTRDGSRFLMTRMAHAGSRHRQVDVILGWFERLRGGSKPAAGR